MEEKLYQITLNTKTVGAVVKDDIVIKCAPFIKWSKGKPIQVLLNWIKQKGGKYALVY